MDGDFFIYPRVGAAVQLHFGRKKALWIDGGKSRDRGKQGAAEHFFGTDEVEPERPGLIVAADLHRGGWVRHEAGGRPGWYRDTGRVCRRNGRAGRDH